MAQASSLAAGMTSGRYPERHPDFAVGRRDLLRADLERELEKVVLDCAACGKRVHFVGGLGVEPGHWSHAEPAPHATPKLNH
jgi:hypothetical protein